MTQSHSGVPSSLPEASEGSTRRRWPSSGAVVLSGVLLFGVFAFLLAVMLNRWDWLTPRSERFNAERFLEVKAGDDINQVVASLGEPIKVIEVPASSESKGYAIYCFLGKPPAWVLFYTSAEVTVDSTGKVVARVLE